ncbi:MAG: 50S ribosomal protein L11 methyltransferase [Verrucomicrobia bacterium]|nr:50S ribosomal protein L11 methyltransferase [Verrucomicrobiota bacterium]
MKSSSSTSPASASWTVVTLLTGAAHAERLADWAREASGVEPVQLLKPRDTRAWLDLYFKEAGDAQAFLLASERQRLVLGRAVRICRPRDWQRFWRKHFHVLTVGGRLRIVPEWSRAGKPPRGVKDLRLEPGLSFGTGTHFTTRFCLERLAVLCRPGHPRSMLDAGTGSGILAIAAVRMGASKVLATDNDPQALAAARKNALRNRTAAHIRFAAADVIAESPRGRFDLVCANLYGPLLLEAAPALAAATRRTLLLSGIRELEADTVADAYAAEGLAETVRDGDGEWCGLEFTRLTPRRRSREA